ncbi:polyadenylate-binding protein 2-B-like [Acanthaster planci]|uniref:Polyadenylate-binding protein 2-B-like n=1 Tax=Acanthaster planci TaxID=133434 RepID=A0A8B7YPX4_ACAPL|nr:polyadenylate-binding protein 2-B-like [Acanthaster planci]
MADFLDDQAEDALVAGPDEETSQGLQSPGADETGVEDAELEAIKARVREMEEEAEKLKEMQSEVEKQMNMSSPPAPGPAAPLSLEDKQEVDSRSVYVGNVDYSTTAEELEEHFHGCGSINRVTILCDKFTGHPKGFAYVEFSDKDMVEPALALHESLFKGRQIKVSAKRTNRPGISTTDRPGRARFRGAARSVYRGGYSPYANLYSGYRPRRYRPRRYSRYSPY